VAGSQDPPAASFQVASWSALFDHDMRNALIRILPEFLRSRRWFKGSGRSVESVTFLDAIALRPSSAWVLLTRIEFGDGDAEVYSLFASVAAGDEAERVKAAHPDAVASRIVAADGSEGILYSGLWDKGFASTLLESIIRRRRIRGEAGELAGIPVRSAAVTGAAGLEATVHRASKANSSFIVGTSYILKLFRSVEPGPHPEVEMSRVLSERGFTQTAPLAGRIEYAPRVGVPYVLGVLHSFVPHEADAWRYTMDSLSRYFERISTKRGRPDANLFGAKGIHPFALSNAAVPPTVSELTGEYLERARLLGQRTGELHRALGEADEPDFAPEPFTAYYRQGLYHSVLALLSRAIRALQPAPDEASRRLLALEGNVRDQLRAFRDTALNVQRIRVHGNYNLNEVLYTGKDFVITDFEGDVSRSMSERRAKRPALYDVASMLVSFHDAAHAARRGQAPGQKPSGVDPAAMGMWADCWYRWAGAAFAKGYRDAVGADEPAVLLSLFMLERFLQGPEPSADRLAGVEGVMADWPSAGPENA
jgi:maltose alpha-D-glucosyltransferase/alpha-amylase